MKRAPSSTEIDLVVPRAAVPVQVQRFAGGEPILRPAGDDWESGVTFNAGVVLLPEAEQDREPIAELLRAAGLNSAPRQPIVAVLYRARPRTDPGYTMTRSYTGLALFSSGMKLLHRFTHPVVRPSDDPAAADYLGVEDPRITRVGARFVMVYCGCGTGDQQPWRATLCMARSSDLMNWQRSGPIPLTTTTPADGHINNKDGVLFPPVGDGWHYLLHRPMIGPISGWSIHLARCRSLDGAWVDLGPLLRPRPERTWSDTWIGAGAVPLPLGGGRYLEIYHSGHRAADGSRLYTLGAAVLNLARIDPACPQSIVESRLDHFMVPQTRWEIEGPYPDSVGNVLFTCGAYESDGQIHILYGGGDTFVMAARVARDELLAALSECGNGH